MADTDEHTNRINKLLQRSILFEDECLRLKSFLEAKSPFVEIADEDKLKDYKLKLKNREEYVNFTQANLFYCRLNRAQSMEREQKIYCRLIYLDKMTDMFQNHVLNESLRILKYLSNREKFSTFMLKITAMLKTGTCFYVFHEKFEQSTNLLYKLWNRDEISHLVVRELTIQLADAVEALNLLGVAHRFIRAENVFIFPENRLKLSAFDMACFFWNVEQKKPIMQKSMLPCDCNKSLLDHLPPECFNETYDASNVDIWSIGTLICLMLTRNNPFYVENDVLVCQWKKCWERRVIKDELRSILDDIFKDADYRMTAFDLRHDKRLSNQGMKLFYSDYYRIDIFKNINTVEAEVKKPPPSQAPLFHPDFSPNSRYVFELQGYNLEKNEESLRKLGYIVDRNDSFNTEMSIFINDFYLKGYCNNKDVCLVKILMLDQIPTRHRNLLLNESSRIIRYFSEQETMPKNYIHKIISAYLFESKLYIFYENILHCKSMYNLFMDQSSTVPTNNTTKQWFAQLSETIDFLIFHSISHRYIRPEYVFVDNYNNIKLSHFDLACFVCNSTEGTQVLRHRGLQDELEHMWDHLPPECFNMKYDALLVDIWSFGVLMLFCLTQKNPFKIPFNNDEAQQMWNSFKTQTHQQQLSPYMDVLNKIFVNCDRRIRSVALMKRFTNPNTPEMESKLDGSRVNSSHTRSTISCSNRRNSTPSQIELDKKSDFMRYNSGAKVNSKKNLNKFSLSKSRVVSKCRSKSKSTF